MESKNNESPQTEENPDGLNVDNQKQPAKESQSSTGDNLMTLDELGGHFLSGDGQAAFLLACLDFSYYVQMMNRRCPLEDAQIMWQHSLDLAHYSCEKCQCKDGKMLLHFMQNMLKNQDENAFMECFKFVIVSMKKHLKFDELVVFKMSPEIQDAIAVYERKQGIDNDKYRLLRAMLLRGHNASAGKSWKSLILKFLALVAFFLLIGIIVTRCAQS